MSFSHLSDQALLAGLEAHCADERHVIARQVLYLAEVEDRRLDLKGAYSSMFDFCTRGLGMSDGVAFRRLNAARLSRRFPTLIGAIERGDVHLCGLVELKEILTEANFDEVLAEAKGKSTRQLQELVARRKAARQAGASPPSLSASETPLRTPVLEPRRRMYFDASAALQAKLDRARDLMRHRVPAGDLAAVIESAVDLLLAKLEKERLGKASRPQPVQRPTKPGRIARAVRREVFERDGEQCTFVAESGERCPSRALLELDHIESRALGGNDDASNLRIRCRPHNRLHAEQVFGKGHVKRRIDDRRRASRRAEKRAGDGSAPTGREETAAYLCIKCLANMGFEEAKAQRVVKLIHARHLANGSGATFEDLFRAALAELR